MRREDALGRTILVLAPCIALAAACKSDTNLFDQVQVDTFAQAPNNEVDILWVVDDSNSMTEEQDTLIRGFTSFASQLRESQTEFQLGVISTSFDYDDEQRGVLKGEPRFLTPSDDFEAAFAARAAVGVGGSDKEKGLEAAVHALHPSMTLAGLGGDNEGFVRPDAQLLVVVVSDEEDCSDRGALEGQPADACYADAEALPPVAEFVQDLRGLKADHAMVRLGAIVGTEGSTCPEQILGSRYITAARLTGGLVGDICRSDWSEMLADLGLDATGIHTRFQLTRAARPSTIEVTVDGQAIAEHPESGWTYDAFTWYLTFHGGSVPERGAVVTVTYTVQAGVNEPPAEVGELTDEA